MCSIFGQVSLGQIRLGMEYNSLLRMFHCLGQVMNMCGMLGQVRSFPSALYEKIEHLYFIVANILTSAQKQNVRHVLHTFQICPKSRFFSQPIAICAVVICAVVVCAVVVCAVVICAVVICAVVVCAVVVCAVVVCAVVVCAVVVCAVVSLPFWIRLLMETDWHQKKADYKAKYQNEGFARQELHQ